MTPIHRRRAVCALALSFARADGTVPGHVVSSLAADAGVDARTLRRWLSRGEAHAPVVSDDLTDPTEPAGRARWAPTEAQMAVIAGSVNLAEAHRDLAATDPGVPSYPTFRRGVSNLDSGIAAAITRRGGAAALLTSRVYLKVGASRRNERWVMDSQEVPVRVLAPRDVAPRKYWQTTALDEATRMVMATVLTKDRPTSADVAACVATGIRGTTLADGTFIGGVPESIVWDNAAEFLSNQVTEMAVRLAFTGTAVTPYAPYEKGKIERWHRTVQEELYAKLPGYSHGPKSFSQKEMWSVPKGQHLTEDLLVAHALLWVEQYNTQRPHGSLAGQTPLALWQSDPAPLRQVGDDALFDAMLSTERPRKVSSNGVRFHNEDYVDVCLNPLVGQTVQVRFLPHDGSFIEVFRDGQHVGTAVPADKVDQAGRRELMAARRDQYTEARALLARAAELRRQRYEDAVSDEAGVMPPLSAQPDSDPRAADTAGLLRLMQQQDSQPKPKRNRSRTKAADADGAVSA